MGSLVVLLMIVEDVEYYCIIYGELLDDLLSFIVFVMDVIYEKIINEYFCLIILYGNLIIMFDVKDDKIYMEWVWLLNMKYIEVMLFLIG